MLLVVLVVLVVLAILWKPASGPFDCQRCGRFMVCEEPDMPCWECIYDEANWRKR